MPHRLRYAPYTKDEVVNIASLTSRVNAITQFLDEVFDRSTIFRAEYLYGEKLDNREIVRKTKAFWHELETVSPLTPFSERFSKLFLTQDRQLAGFFEALYRKSKAFKKVFNYYAASLTSLDDKWGLISLKITDPSLLPTVTHDGRNAIYFLGDGLQYLSSTGLKEIEKERWFLYRALEKLSGLNAFALTEEIERMATRDENQLSRMVNQRGEVHQLVNQIFEEAKPEYPSCLSGVFLKPGDAQLRQILTKQHISLNRIVMAEDDYLEKLLYNNPSSCLPPCIGPSSSALKSSVLNHEPHLVETNHANLHIIRTGWITGLSLGVGSIITMVGALWIKRFRRSQNSVTPSGVVNIPLLPVSSIKSIPAATTVASQLLTTEAKKVDKKAILCRPKTKKSLHSFKDIESNKAIRRKAYFFNSSLPNSVSSSPSTIPALCETYLPQLVNNNQLQLASLFFTRSPRSKMKIRSNLHQAEAVILAQELIASIRQSLETYFPEINRASVLGEVDLFNLQNQLAICFEMHNFSKIEANMSTAFKTLYQKLSPEAEKALKTNLTDLVNTFVDQALFFSGRFQLS